MTSAASVARFDAAFDAALEQLRGHPVSDRIFRTASALGDWSVIWELVGAAWGLTSDRRTDRALRLAVLLGVESLVVNQGIKRLFKRARPTLAGDPRLPVRRPSTSSFPSGHASSGSPWPPSWRPRGRTCGSTMPRTSWPGPLSVSPWPPSPVACGPSPDRRAGPRPLAHPVGIGRRGSRLHRTCRLPSP